MHVICKKCNTTYSLDSDLVKDSGTKVRCSRCKHVFVVFNREHPGVMSATLDRPGNKTELGNNESNFEQIVDDDLGYWKEKEARIRNHRVEFENFFDDDKCPQNAATFEPKPEANETIDISDDQLPEDDNFIASAGGGNEEAYDEDERSAVSFKDDEREFLEIDTGFEARDILYDSDDFGIEDDFDVNTEGSDRDLPDENPDIPLVPTLDEDFDLSLYCSETEDHDDRGRPEWENFDFEPDEFDEQILLPVFDEVDTDKDVSVDDRACQMALQIAEDYGWSYEQTQMLADVFKDYGWSLTRNRIINELRLGMKFYEFQFAVELRQIWKSHTEYSVGYVKIGSFGDNSLKYRSIYKTPDWAFCLKIIRRFDSIPGPEELEHHLDSLYNIWKNNPVIQSRHNTFYGFIRDAVDAGDDFSEMQAWQFLH